MPFSARARDDAPPPHAPLLDVVGADLEVPLVVGGRARYVNLDYAASAPCLPQVAEAVSRALPWYSSVHRGAGFASTVCTELLASARAAIGAFVGARAEDAVILTRHTTDALNLLAAALPEGTTVVSFAAEHHANMLPWRRGRHVLLPVPREREALVDRVTRALAEIDSPSRLLAITGASNVTGEVWPVRELTVAAHRQGARVVLDAAQLAPHRAISLAELGVDYVALSGHKLYAPFGTGALVGRADWLDAAPPYLAGGGAVRRVSADETEWADGPSRHEAGTPNTLGAIALAEACRTLTRAGMDRVAAHERALVRALVDGLRALPGVKVLSLWPDATERIGVVPFTARGWHAGHLACALSAEHGIGVRDGAFCAHPLMASLLPGSARTLPSALRVSIGVGSRADDVERLLAALHALLTRGARWRYAVDAGRYVPSPDPRPRPSIHRDPLPSPPASRRSQAGCASMS